MKFNLCRKKVLWIFFLVKLLWNEFRYISSIVRKNIRRDFECVYVFLFFRNDENSSYQNSNKTYLIYALHILHWLGELFTKSIFKMIHNNQYQLTFYIELLVAFIIIWIQRKKYYFCSSIYLYRCFPTTIYTWIDNSIEIVLSKKIRLKNFFHLYLY